MIGPKFYGWDNDGNPLAFGKLYTYRTDTTELKDTYQGEGGVTPNTNPVILNGEGYANVYLSGSYNMILRDADDNDIWSQDPVSENNSSEWTNCTTVEYVSTNSFKIAGNVTEEYDLGRRVRIEQGSSFIYSTITEASFAGGYTTIEVSDQEITVSIAGACSSIVGSESASVNSATSLAVETFLNTAGSYPDVIIANEYFKNTNFGGGTWVKTGETGTASVTDYDNGLMYDGSGYQRKLTNIEVTPGMLGAVADGVADDSAAIQSTFEFADVVKFDRMYYTSETITMPSIAGGKVIKGINSETSGVSTLDGFAGDEISASSATGGGSMIVVSSSVSHELEEGDSVYIYGADQNEYNGYYDSVTIYSDILFGCSNFMNFPSSPTLAATGSVKFRKCKSVIESASSGTYDKLTLKDFKIDGASSISSGCGNAIDFSYSSSTPDSPLTKVKFENLTLSAYGGAAAMLSGIFSGDFERLYVSSELHHAIHVDDSSGSTTFRNCNIVKAGRSKAGIYSLKDVSIEALNVINDGAGASYAIYAGSTTENGDSEDYSPKVMIKNCNFEGFFLNTLVFPFHAGGDIIGNIFTLASSDTDSFIYSGNQSPDNDSTIKLNANTYDLSTFSLAVDRFVVDEVLEKNYRFEELFVGVDEINTNSYTINSGTYAGEKAFSSLQGSYINPNIAEDSITSLTIDALGKDFLTVTGLLAKDTISGKENGDRVRLYASEQTELRHMTVPATGTVIGNIAMSSLNDVTMEIGQIFEFEQRDDILYQIDGMPSDEVEYDALEDGESVVISGVLPREKATYIVTRSFEVEGVVFYNKFEVRTGAIGDAEIVSPPDFTAGFSITAEVYFARFMLYLNYNETLLSSVAASTIRINKL